MRSHWTAHAPFTIKNWLHKAAVAKEKCAVELSRSKESFSFWVTRTTDRVDLFEIDRRKEDPRRGQMINLILSCGIIDGRKKRQRKVEKCLFVCQRETIFIVKFERRHLLCKKQLTIKIIQLIRKWRGKHETWHNIISYVCVCVCVCVLDWVHCSDCKYDKERREKKRVTVIYFSIVGQTSFVIQMNAIANVNFECKCLISAVWNEFSCWFILRHTSEIEWSKTFFYL